MASKSSSTPRRNVGTVGAAIRQTRPFRSPSQEALIAMLMTTERVGWDDALSSIGSKVREPGITRLLDRLERKGLCERARSATDRRQVFCHITRAGLDLLARLDRPIDALDDAAFAALSATELRQLIKLLDKIRAAQD